MRSPRRRLKNAEVLELAQILDRLHELRGAWYATQEERWGAERSADTLLAKEYEEWARAMRESGRAAEIHRGKPVEPRTAARVEAEGRVAEAKEHEREALARYQEAQRETGERRVELRDFTAEDQRRLVKLRGWPTNRYMKGMRESPKDLAYVSPQRSGDLPALSRKELRGHWRAQSAPILAVLCQM